MKHFLPHFLAGSTPSTGLGDGSFVGLAYVAHLVPVKDARHTPVFIAPATDGTAYVKSLLNLSAGSSDAA